MTYLFKEYIYSIYIYTHFLCMQKVHIQKTHCSPRFFARNLSTPNSPGRQEAAGSDAGTDPCHSCESVSWEGRFSVGVPFGRFEELKNAQHFLSGKRGSKRRQKIYGHKCKYIYIHTYLDYVFRHV